MDSRRLLITDLDGTLLGDAAALARFAAWHAANSEKAWLAYATGRSLEEIESLVEETPLPRPDVSIIQVGTEIYDRHGRAWPGWDRRFAGWDADVARSALAGVPWLRPQPERYQTMRKASYHAAGIGRPEVASIRRRLRRAGLSEAKLVYSAGLYLDVLPPGSGKGEAARAVARTLAVARADVLVFGDTANDLDLFLQGYRGTVVANALPELTAAAGDAYHSPYRHADGVLDGVRHWWTPNMAEV
jgi:sucrose-6F-phosphate phosphohydrolase